MGLSIITSTIGSLGRLFRGQEYKPSIKPCTNPLTLIMVHTAAGSIRKYAPFDIDRASKYWNEEILKSGLVGQAYEYVDSSDYPTIIDAEYPRHIIDQSHARTTEESYRIPGLCGDEFILTGGDPRACYHDAFKNLAAHFAASPDTKFVVHMPADAIYHNTWGFWGGERTLVSANPSFFELIGYRRDYELELKHYSIDHEIATDTWERSCDARVRINLWPKSSNMLEFLKSRAQIHDIYM